MKYIKYNDVQLKIIELIFFLTIEFVNFDKHTCHVFLKKIKKEKNYDLTIFYAFNDKIKF